MNPSEITTITRTHAFDLRESMALAKHNLAAIIAETCGVFGAADPRTSCGLSIIFINEHVCITVYHNKTNEPCAPIITAYHTSLCELIPGFANLPIFS